MTPERSCSRLQPSSAVSVALLVRRVWLRVMLTTTTDEDMATQRPRMSATSMGWPERCQHEAGDDRGGDDLERRGCQQRAVFASQPAHVQLDADLEEQQHHADIGQQLHLLAVGLAVLRQQLEGDQADHQVADHGGQPEATRDVPEDGRRQEQHCRVRGWGWPSLPCCQRSGRWLPRAA